eukprot:TRINITY_DN4243_c0_g1_i1.p1 TRINITY_DN4243_c0_g1~~TRINITY_DN4243_c0_g1_i1.p1  ORF type:complete len:364 (+),score=71.51 TRINITY_DN4243_c0_g1_i1:57-1148(+)
MENVFGRSHIYTLIELLGEGSFGVIYSARMAKHPEPVALKIQKKGISQPNMLKYEYAILKKLQKSSYVPRLLDFGIHEGYDYLSMDLMGENLTYLKKNYTFDQTTSLQVCIYIIDAIESMHELGFIHRDIKPANFVIPRGQYHSKKIYVIDFGLSKKFIDENGDICPPRDDAGFRGTVRYASLNSHSREDLGRRDDMWSVFYILMELLKGELPWGNTKDKEEVFRLKQRHKPMTLIEGLEEEYAAIVEHLNSLSFYDKPDYDYIRSVLRGILADAGELHRSFSWEKFQKGKYSSPNKENLRLVNDELLFIQDSDVKGKLYETSSNLSEKPHIEFSSVGTDLRDISLEMNSEPNGCAGCTCTIL